MNGLRAKLASPERRFCGVCGHPVSPRSLTWHDPVGYCRAHDDVPRLDAIPPDPLGHPVPPSAVRERGEARIAQNGAVLPQKPGTATEVGSAEPTSEHLSAPPREAASPADGTELC